MDFSRQAIKACYALGCSCSPFETMDNEPNTIPDGLVRAGVAGARPDYERPIQRPPCIVNWVSPGYQTILHWRASMRDRSSRPLRRLLRGN
jgi:hypothetical protein